MNTAPLESQLTWDQSCKAFWDKWKYLLWYSDEDLMNSMNLDQENLHDLKLWTVKKLKLDCKTCDRFSF